MLPAVSDGLVWEENCGRDSRVVIVEMIAPDK